MAKRFYDTKIWGEDWFLDLPSSYKIFWNYVLAMCDHAGIWKPNLGMFQRLTTEEVNLQKALDLFNNGKSRIDVLANSRWFVIDFIVFQYGPVLNSRNRVHQSIISLLEMNDVSTDRIRGFRGLKGVGQRVKDKDKDKDKSLSPPPSISNKLILTQQEISNVIDEILEYWNSKPQLSNILALNDKRITKLRLRIKEDVFIKNWKQAIMKIAASDFCVGKNDRNWKASFDWFIENNMNYIKVLEGKYDDKRSV